ncbi:hypothetical protein, partial [Pedobacter sp.]|uniref:hypothetical protein n=1 Tax=Pedobacter sp. TaxID=1411316 RepID=UPI003D7F56C1
NFLVKLHGLSSEERRRKLTITVFNQYHQLNPDSINLGDQYTDQVLQLIIKSGLFEDYYAFFRPLHYNNSYNELLIGSLLEIGNVALAEKFSLEQIEEYQQ